MPCCSFQSKIMDLSATFGASCLRRPGSSAARKSANMRLGGPNRLEENRISPMETPVLGSVLWVRSHCLIGSRSYVWPLAIWAHDRRVKPWSTQTEGGTDQKHRVGHDLLRSSP